MFFVKNKSTGKIQPVGRNNAQKAALLVSIRVDVVYDTVFSAFQFQILQWTGDSVSSPEQT